jgi:taurine dioxygenase
MSYETIAVRKTSPHIGAEIAGVNLSDSLSNRQVDELHQALDDHLVLFFRDQDLDYDSAKRLGRHFGELAIHPNTPGPDGQPEILPIYADAQSKVVAGERWHSDVSCNEELSYASILNLKTVPSEGGDTIFASQYAAYDALSARLKTYLEGLTALHDGGPAYRSSNARRGIAENGKVYPSAVHPVVRTNPKTGRKALFVNETFTVRLLGVPDDEGRALLAFLTAHAARPDFQTRFVWKAGSVALWDNRYTQHLAIWDYYPQTRSGFRVTITGDKPV